jgi:hypothetical protein
VRLLAAAAASFIWALVWRPGWLVLAQASPAGGDPIAALIAAGPAGVCLVLVLVGWLNPKSVTDRQDRALERAEKQRDDLAAQLAEVIPVLALVQTTMLPMAESNKAAMAAQQQHLDVLTVEIRRLGNIVDARRGSGG